MKKFKSLSDFFRVTCSAFQTLTLDELKLRSQVTDCQKKLIRYLKDQVKTDGTITNVCNSRVLESSLMLHLLTIEEIHPNYQYHLTQYLRTQLDKEHNNKFYKALILGALRKSTSSDAQVIEDYMGGFQHFTAGRKRVLFGAILAELQVIPYDSQYQIEHFFYHDYQSWVAAEICALKVLYAFGLNHPKWITDDDVEFLLSTQKNSSIWEKHVLANIIILLALQKFPEHAHVVLKRINSLLSCQNSDGGFPFIASFEIFCTATAGVALTNTEVDIETLLQMAEYVVGQQQLDGGWAYAEGVNQTDVDDTCFCVEFLQAVDPEKYKECISKAEVYLLGIQNQDGGFPTFVRGNPSEITMTAAALNSLAHRAAEYKNIFSLGLGYITSQQRVDGSFERSWSLSEAQAIFRCVLAMRTCEIVESAQLLESIQTAEAKALNYLQKSQNSDGGWGHQLGDASDVISTSYTIIALSSLGDTKTLRRGLHYLMQQQDEEGKFVSIPDQAAPRPIPYDVPILTSIFALLALKYAAAVITE
jgi:squalene-hopene/tetraprenyl-beta-curcumene cyclase/sporulenol synthase